MNPPRWPAIHAWALYDFALTVFSMNVVSTYFALWVTKDHGASDLTYGLAKSLSMALVIGLAPIAGSRSDASGRRKPFLVGATLVMGAATIAMAFAPTLAWGLVLFGIANIGFQLAGVFYNALLPTLAPPALIGRISGYGRSLAYLGALVAVFLGSAFATGKLFGHETGLPAGGSAAVFVPTAVLLLAASVPLLLSREQPAPVDARAHDAGALWAGLKELFRDPGLRNVRLFIVGSFFFCDTLNTIRDFMSIYLTRVVGLSETGGSLQGFLAAVVLCSLVGALGWGVVVDRRGPKQALVGVLALLAAGIVGLVVVSTPALVTRVVGPILGLAFGGVLVATRPLLVRLVPLERQGLFFGLFILANDAGAILGPVTWGAIVKGLEAQGPVAYQVALMAELAFLVIGLVCILKVAVPPAQEA